MVSHGEERTETTLPTRTGKKTTFFTWSINSPGEYKTIGLEFDHVNLVNFDKFKDALPKASLVDVGDPTMKMRMIKSGEEIAHIKQGRLFVIWAVKLVWM